MKPTEIRLFLLCISALLVLSVIAANAQHRSRTHSSFGVVAGAGLNIHNAGFSALPGVDNCCEEFNGGTGFGIGGGITWYAPVVEGFGLQMLLAYQDMSADLIEEENIGPVITPRGPEDGIVEHRLYSKTQAIEFRPTVFYSIIEALPVDLYVGPHLALLMTNDVHQEEAFISPEDNTFKDGSRVRNQFPDDGGYEEMPEAAGFYAGLSAGIQSHVFLNDKWWLLPEFSIGTGVTSLSDGVDWTPNFMRFSIGLMFTPPEPPPPPPPPPTPPPPALDADIQIAVKAEDGTTLPEFKIVVEEISKSELFPLLPYVFFAQASADLDSTRQHLLESAGTAGFDETTLPNNTLDIYKDLLNIVGERMRNYPEANITLTGCNNMTGEERNNRQLSRARAVAVQQYLAGVWDIDEGRIQIKTRNYPTEAPDRTTLEGQQEARRVEIASDTYEIIQPILWKDVEREVRTPSVLITPSIYAEAGIHAWSVSAFDADRTFTEFQDMNGKPGQLEWAIDPANAPKPGTSVTVKLQVWDKAGQSRTKTLELPVDQEIRTREIVEERAGKRVDRFSLILFEFKKSDIGPENRKILDIVRDAITPRSRVTIYGYADRTGTLEYNRNLAMDRCQSVQRALGESIEGIPVTLEPVGSERLLYNNDLPEGRNFCRTVQIVVETGIE